MLIRRNLYPYFSFFIQKSPSLSKLNLYSTSTIQKLPQNSNFMRDYLISSCGFSPIKATIASKTLSHINSSERPDSVVHFFKQVGFNDKHVRKIVSSVPSVFRCDVQKTIQPKFQALRGLGFTDQELFKFITSNPQVVVRSKAASRIEFWKNFLGDDTNKLLLAFTRNRGMVNLDIDKNVIPKISLLRNNDFSDTDIRMAITGHHCIITRSINAIEEMLKRSLKLGFREGSKMRLHSLLVLARLNGDNYKEKTEFYKSFGWSESDLLGAMQKHPNFVLFSKENIRAKMECLVKRAGCTQSYIASHPVILALSLKNRLVPRCQLIKLLKSRLVGFKEMDVYTIMSLSEEKFKKKYIYQFSDEVPELMEMYNALCSCQVSR